MSEPTAPSGQGKPGPTVLVIDDDDLGRALLCEALREVSKRTIELSSPIGATRVVSREQVDVVVLDVEMPNLRGDMLAKLFRNNARVGHVGVVLVSGCSAEELDQLGKSCGADETVSKRYVRLSLGNAVRAAWIASRTRAADKSGALRAEDIIPGRPGAGHGR